MSDQEPIPKSTEVHCWDRFRGDMTNVGLEHSDYIVYVDESGDHSLESINPRYPLFVLAFCVFQKDHYIQKVIPDLNRLKISTFGHDQIVLHEQEIRKKTGAFNKLNVHCREALMNALSNLMAEIDLGLIPIVIDKCILKKRGPDPTHVYHLAMQIGLEKLFRFLQERDQHDRLTHVIFEARGRCEDLSLELEFRRICAGQNSLQHNLSFEIIIADKKTNCVGLQIADIAARPIGLSVFEARSTKSGFRNLGGEIISRRGKNTGTICLPFKSERPRGSPRGSDAGRVVPTHLCFHHNKRTYLLHLFSKFTAPQLTTNFSGWSRYCNAF